MRWNPGPSYRDKPQTRPGFPGGPPRQVPSKPEFPPAEPRSGARQFEDSSAMIGSRSISIGRDAVGNVMITGDRNRVDASIDAGLTRTTLLPGGSVQCRAD